MKTRLNPYLNFNGNTKEAMEFYHSVLGGDLKMSTFGESMPTLDEGKDKIMHAVLENHHIVLMASDGPPGSEVKFGDNVSLSLVGSDSEFLTKYFNDLAEGGKITMPLEKQSWGDTFGMLIDKFGIQWMVNISSEKSEHDDDHHHEDHNDHNHNHEDHHDHNSED